MLGARIEFVGMTICGMIGPQGDRLAEPGGRRAAVKRNRASTPKFPGRFERNSLRRNDVAHLHRCLGEDAAPPVAELG